MRDVLPHVRSKYKRIFLVVQSSRQIARRILESVSRRRTLGSGLQFLCSFSSSLLAVYLGLRHALKLVCSYLVFSFSLGNHCTFLASFASSLSLIFWKLFESLFQLSVMCFYEMSNALLAI